MGNVAGFMQVAAPFGAVMPGRNASPSSYRYSYQGQEKADNSKWHNFELRMYNASTGRFLCPDPKGEFHSPYIGMGNNPINRIDPDGGQTTNYGQSQPSGRVLDYDGADGLSGLERVDYLTGTFSGATLGGTGGGSMGNVSYYQLSLKCL